jgi:hypothetical protein
VTDLSDFARLVPREHGLIVISTLRGDGTIQSSGAPQRAVSTIPDVPTALTTDHAVQYPRASRSAHR